MLKLAEGSLAQEAQRHVFYVESVELCDVQRTESEERDVFLKKNSEGIILKMLFLSTGTVKMTENERKLPIRTRRIEKAVFDDRYSENDRK